MIRKRPTGVLVIAILHLVGGGLLLLGTVCGAVVQAATANLQKSAPAGPGGVSQQEMQAEMEKVIEKQAPGYKAVQYSETGLSLVIALLLLIAGVGLLSMQPWARLLSITYAIISILDHIFSLVYAFAFIVPATQAAAEQVFANDPSMKGAPAGVTQVASIGAAAVVLVQFAFIAYPITVLIVMTRRSVVAAFRGELPEEEMPQRDRSEPEEYWDDRIQPREEGFTDREP
jgi:hypothetical protein